MPVTDPPIAYAGEPGAFAEDAVLAAFGDVRRTPLGSFRAVFEAVTDGDASAGVVPIENVINGTVRENYDLLIEFDLTIHGEVMVAVRLCLAALPGQRLEDIQRVYSHIQALGQAEMFLRSRPWQLLSTYNTAGAGKAIADTGERGAGAVLSPRAAALFGLDPLAEDIGDLPGTGRASSCSLDRRAFAATGRSPVASADHPGCIRPQRAGDAVGRPAGHRRARSEHAQARVTAQPGASLGIRLLDRPRR